MAVQDAVMVWHPVQERLKELERRVLELDLAEVPSGADDALRVREVLAYARLRTSANPVLVSSAMLDRIGPSLDPLTVILDEFDTTLDPAHLQRAATGCDGVLDAVGLLPELPTDGGLDAERQLNVELRDQFTASLASVRAAEQAAFAELATVKGQTVAAKAESEARLAELAAELEALRTTVAAQTTQVATLVTTFQTNSAAQLDTARSDFQTTTADAVAEIRAQSTTAIGEFTVSSTESAQAFAGRAEATVARLEALSEQAAQLVDVVSGTATAGGYKKLADDEARAANIWRWVIVGCVVAVVCVGIWVLATVRTNETAFEWHEFLAKVFLTVPVGLFAAYAGKQSAGHRDTERRARHTQLQLAALEPYVASLPDEEAARVRAEFAAYLFGPAPAATAGDDAEVITGPALVGLFNKTLTAALKH